MTDDRDRQLERLLDEAARQLQPKHPGWRGFIDRLGPQAPSGETLDADTPPEEPQVISGKDSITPSPEVLRRRRVRRIISGISIAAAILIAVMLVPSLFPPSDEGGDAQLARRGGTLSPLEQPVFAEMFIPVERQSIELTVFNPIEMPQPTLYMPLAGGSSFANAAAQRGFGRLQPQATQQGMALVKDRRMMLNLKEGDNLVKFTDVAATIDPTSVRLTSETDPASLVIVEQNFEFDLASADAILQRFVGTDNRVSCVTKDNGQVYTGFLLSFDAVELVLGDRLPDEDDEDAPRPRTQTIARSGLKAIQIAKMPADLYVRPTLVWRVRASRAGDHRALLTYLCGRVEWQADYVVLVRDSDPQRGDMLDLQGWVTIDNRSGTTYQESGIKLIAGDVNRVVDPWAAGIGGFGRQRYWFLAFGPGQSSGGGMGGGKEFVQREFFEYKLYELNQPSTIRDSQIKQLGLLKAEGIKARRRYRYDHQLNAGRAMVELIATNSEENALGRPLPKGRVILMARDRDGESHLIGRDEIDHTPKNEKIEFTLGAAFDVVGQFRTVSREQLAREVEIFTYEITVRNHKSHPIDVRAVGHLQGNLSWEITDTDAEFTNHDFQTIYFDFRLEADAERVIRYAAQYESPKVE